MNTRRAALRFEDTAAASRPQRTTRSTQRNDAALTANTPPEARISQVKPPASIKQNRVLLKDPVPRRNAPLRAQREDSISTNPVGPDDETEFWEDDENIVQNEEPDNQLEDVDVLNEESQHGLELDPATLKNLKILQLMIPDLTRTADSLYEYLRQEPTNDEVFQACLSIKRRAFYNIQSDFKKLGQPCKGDFIDIKGFEELNSTQQQILRIAQIARVNTVIAYDRIHDVEDDEAAEIYTFLKTFNQIFPDTFLPDPELFQGPEVILNLRTWLLVEALSQTQGESNLSELFVEFFCDPRKIEELDSVEERRNYPMLLAGQYFRELGESDHTSHDELCSSRIIEITHIFKKNDRRKAIAQLAKKYPLQDLLANLRDCLHTMYNILTYAENTEFGTQSPYPDQQTVGESQGDDFGSESQSIIRAESQEAEPSLFVNKRSLLALEHSTQASSAPPASYQQSVGSRSGVPRDYHEHTNADLMGSPFPPASSFRLASKNDSDQQRGQKRPRSGTVGDDEDDAFETDNRRVDPTRRDELRRQMPPPPRPELVSEAPQRRIPVPSSARSIPPAFEQESSRNSASGSASRPSPSPVGNYEALKMAASQRNREARQANPERQGTKQRVSWSEHDTQLLLDFIKDFGVRWSRIESEGHGYFEHPRNQQAYRDRARNLKTELLIVDAVLPPNFNDVALSNKEIIKIKGCGKNPYRREEDIDANGNPINTELAESTPF